MQHLKVPLLQSGVIMVENAQYESGKKNIYFI